VQRTTFLARQALEVGRGQNLLLEKGQMVPGGPVDVDQVKGNPLLYGITPGGLILEWDIQGSPEETDPVVAPLLWRKVRCQPIQLVSKPPPLTFSPRQTQGA
jgi:hypothetical protein